MPQLSIPDRMEKAYAGQVTEAGYRFCRSAFAEGALVTSGMPVKRGTAAGQAEPFEAGDTPSAGNFLGVVVHSPTRGVDGIEDGDGIDVMRAGSIFMDFSEAVSEGEQVHITLATGALKGVAQGTAAAVGDALLPGLRIAETISAAGLATVEVGLFGT